MYARIPTLLLKKFYMSSGVCALLYIPISHTSLTRPSALKDYQIRLVPINVCRDPIFAVRILSFVLPMVLVTPAMRGMRQRAYYENRGIDLKSSK